MTSDLGQNGLLVASGMAREIDAVAHRGTIDKRTVAVLVGALMSFTHDKTRVYIKRFRARRHCF